MNESYYDDKYAREAMQLAALAHPVRLDIVHHLAQRKACCVKDLVDRSDLAQSTISQHLKKLLTAELVTYQTSQKYSWYELNREEFSWLSKRLAGTFALCCADKLTEAAPALCENEQS